LSCGVGHRRGLDLALLWLWCRLAATSPIGPLVWEPPYAAGVDLKRQKDRKKKRIPEIFLRTMKKDFSVGDKIYSQAAVIRTV